MGPYISPVTVRVTVCRLFLLPTVIMSDTYLPGQPLTIPKGPAPQLGPGIYVRDGVARASLVGVPTYAGPVGLELSLNGCISE